MTDLLLELGKNPQARNLIKSLGLPIPVPQALKRPRGPYEERPLAGRAICVHGTGSAVSGAIAQALAEAGAEPWLSGDDAAFEAPGEAFGRRPRRLNGADDGLRFDGVVFDASELKSAPDLRALYQLFHARIGQLKRCGRVVLVGRPPRTRKTAGEAAAQAALDGFTRSLAKELGRKGASAQLLWVDEGAEGNLAGPLRFLLSERSAYVSGQSMTVTAAVGVEPPRKWVFPLQGKVALVTGAARGIGKATAKILAGEGATVVCLDRPADDGPTSRLAREIDGDVLLVDVTDDDAPERIATHLSEVHGGVDIVVHNAGVTRDKTIARMRDDHWDQALDVNLGAVQRITERLLVDGLHDGARIILLSSIAGIAGNVGQTNYAASKAGVIGLVHYLAGALADRRITVNAIAPGFIETRLTDAMPIAIREVARRMNNLGQGGRPADVGQAIAFLATPDAQGLTGQVLRVCGGSLVGA